MHEQQATGEREAEGVDAPDGGMPDAEGDASDGPGVDGLRRVMLAGFLRELVREEGRMEAAELLGVNYKTLVRAEESGEITGRMGDALERLLGTGASGGAPGGSGRGGGEARGGAGGPHRCAGG